MDTASPGRAVARRLARLAPALLLASVAARLAWTYLVPNGANFVDLHVYADQTPDFPLPFTYPPFAALIFYPLSTVPFGLVALAWQLGIIAALYGVVRVSQRLIGVAAGAGHRAAMLWTAVAIWTEPLRSTFDYGQINVVLVLAVLWAAYSTRWWVSGLLVGVAAGIKLTPAIAGVYLVGMRRWAAAALAFAVFAATVALSVAVIGQQARYYFTDLLGDAGRIGPIGTSFNQSWRGGVSRILGHDAGYGPVVLAGIAVTAVLAVLAWRALAGDDAERSEAEEAANTAPAGDDAERSEAEEAPNTAPAGDDAEHRDRLGSLLVVELFGLLISPISWTHHWIWLVPLMIWLLDGPWRTRRGARVLGWGWLGLTLVGVPWLLSFAQPTIWQIDRPWYLAWAGLVYIAATLATLAWIAATGRREAGLSLAPSAHPGR